MAAKKSIVALDIYESRTRNFVRVLERRGFDIVEFKSQTPGAARNLLRFARASLKSSFVLCGVDVPRQLPFVLLSVLMGRQCVVDCPMDIAAWPFPERLHCRIFCAILLRAATLVLTIKSRSYMARKFGISDKRMLYLESCPDYRRIEAATDANPHYQPPDGAFVVCCSGGHEHHRLDRFLPIFEALVPLLPNAVLLVIADSSKPIVEQSKNLATQERYRNKIQTFGVIKPPEDFYATVAECDLWIATMADDTLQGRQELRMELLEIGLLGKAVASALTPGLLEHDFADDQDILALDPSDPKGSAAKIAALAGSPDRLARLGASLRTRVERHFSIEEAIDRLIERTTPSGLQSALNREGA